MTVSGKLLSERSSIVHLSAAKVGNRRIISELHEEVEQFHVGERLLVDDHRAEGIEDRL